MSGRVETLAGVGAAGFSGDGGPATRAMCDNVYGVGRGPDGALYFCDMGNHRVRRIDRRGTIATIAGPDGFDQPYELAWDRNRNLFVCDIGTHTIRRIDAKSGAATIIAGDGTAGFAGDGGPASQARLKQPHSLAFDPAGNLYICDIGNQRVRRIDAKTGVITTWAGGDGSLAGPRAIVFDRRGVAYLALREGNAALRRDPKPGAWRRLAEKLNGPKGIALDRAGNVYLADTESHTIRRIDAKTGAVEVLVGDGAPGDGPDGDDPLRCRLDRPHGVAVERDGSVLIGDSENHRLRVWRPG